ncbi:MAG: hypothetical protein KF800_19100 [Lysobacter sp.]|nr:hypothetical protein [Lysobacter sp.]
MFEPVKAGFGRYMACFYADLIATTRPLEEFVTRGAGKAIMWAPGRMVDAAEEMLSLYARDNIEPGPTKPFSMPIMFVAMAKDYVPSGRDFTRQIGDRVDIALPGDEKGRNFKLRTIAADIRAQVVIAAMDEPTARSLAAQFALHLDSAAGRRFKAPFSFAGEELNWPVQIESPDVQAIAVPSGAKNLTMLAIDIVLRATVPLIDAPKLGDANDGQGVPGTTDPAGYPVVNLIAGTQYEQPDYAPDSEIGNWSVASASNGAP